MEEKNERGKVAEEGAAPAKVHRVLRRESEDERTERDRDGEDRSSGDGLETRW